VTDDRQPRGALDGRVALVTGAARGQGRAHSLALAGEGATVVALDVPRPMASLPYPLATQEDLDETVRLVEKTGATCVGMAVDVRDASAVDDAVQRTLGELGRLDILVANAGIATQSRLWEVTDEAWDEMVATNLTGVFHCLRAAIPPMREQRFGRIVVTASMGGRMGIPNIAHYNATKWGVIGMAKSLALEVATEGITVNVVCPCTVGTPMVLNDEMYRLFAPDIPDPTPEDVHDRFRRVNPIPEPWLAPEDVSRAVLHLVTDRGVVTGSVLEIGLGSSARLH
jgi:SDR family mycofactocin-dependent oxidoreductase